MRLWSIHPRYLDRQALIAGWREALLAQSVLVAPGRGYSKHPQLLRFTEHDEPLTAMAHFLAAYLAEADARGYTFSHDKIAADPRAEVQRIPLARGQLAYEWAHLGGKLALRSPDIAKRWESVSSPDPHPLFTLVDGPIAVWERPRGAVAP
ncbi:pyrimidine dimer DNA glycosylase/endonuclease V [Glaciibacter sp. 2TAF33]|uniref:pyrimidine dimer DNA glycosylase/endonuclease V n=1 Tax=Glaciibacter sp. 2TAF33 TaxID=3233015 RepID=UPI003F8EBC46